MNAKMQPFYVLVNNEDGECVMFYFDEAKIKTEWAEQIAEGTHGIEHIRDQSGLVEELRALRDRLFADSGSDPDALDGIDAILSKYGRE